MRSIYPSNSFGNRFSLRSQSAFRHLYGRMAGGSLPIHCLIGSQIFNIPWNKQEICIVEDFSLLWHLPSG